MITLTITNYSGDDYCFSFSGTSDIAESVFQKKIPMVTRQTVTEPYRKAVSSGVVVMADFTAAGRMIYSLFPDNVQDYLQKNQGKPVLIKTNDVTVPWELCHDGTDFQGLSRPTGRIIMLTTDIMLEPKRSSPDPTAKPSVLIIANPGMQTPELNLPEADKEADALFDFFHARGCRVEVLAGKLANRFSVFSHLEGAYDIIHYAGHAVLGKTENKSQAALVLSDGPLMSSEIMNFLKGDPIVFLNACHTLQAGDPEGMPTPSSYTMGSDNSRDLAQAFILGNRLGGARALIGTLFRNSDTRSRELALVYYGSLLDGETIGEALRTARQHIYMANDVTWASYVLYGNPGLRLSAPAPSSQSKAPRPQETDAEAAAGTPPPMEDASKREDPDDLSNTLDMLGDTAKQALFNALQESGDSSCKMLITPHLFLGMAALKDGFTRTFLSGQVDDPEMALKPIRRLSALLTLALDLKDPSDRFQAIFRLSHDYWKLDPEKPDAIEEKHLLQGFFENGGGMTGSELAKQGIQMPPFDRNAILAMPLFLKTSGDDPPEEEERKDPTEGDDPPGKAKKRDPTELLNALNPTGLKVVDEAISEARSMGHPVLTTPHLLMGVLQVDRDGMRTVIQSYRVNPSDLERTLRSVVKPGDLGKTRDIVISPRCYRILELSHGLSETIEAKHIGMAILEEGIKDPDSITIQVLKHYGLDPVSILETLKRVPTPRADTSPRSKAPGTATPILDAIGRDLTALARDGKLGPLIGKVREIDMISEILLRKSKPCPVLIGEAGVGKTAIVEGFARKVALGEAPLRLKQARIVEITTNALVSGTKYRGEFEERLQKLIAEVSRDENLILFMDEIHTLMGAGASGSGAMHAGDILKPALARGDIKCIGATTIEEYRRWIEPDAALERRFSPVMVEEPTLDETVQILACIKTYYEAHHGVAIPSETVEAAAKLSADGLPHRRLPDKAIDLLDQACARVQLTSEQATESTDQPPVVTVRHIQEILSAITGVPLPAASEEQPDGNAGKLAALEAALSEQVIGQPQAVSSLVQAIGLAETRMREPGRPLAVLMFIGPVGVGKSSLAKAFAHIEGRKLIQIDMTEYSEKHQSAKLIGAPPGYVGYGREGLLTGQLRSHPYSVVLLDEMEKAHPDIIQLFLHLFEEGRITDAKGRTGDARNVIFVITSNVGGSLFSRGSTQVIGFRPPEKSDSHIEITDVLSESFSREFVNRIDQISVFRPLERQDVMLITQRLLMDVKKRLLDSHNLILEEDEDILDFLFERGYARAWGVRPLKRAIDDYITKPLTRMILEGKLANNRTVHVTVENGSVVLR
jgi:ATP-dependent Clp protease ATP-binding subunit ClpA